MCGIYISMLPWSRRQVSWCWLIGLMAVGMGWQLGQDGSQVKNTVVCRIGSWPIALTVVGRQVWGLAEDAGISNLLLLAVLVEWGRLQFFCSVEHI